jgi:hypothetical protein
MVAKTYAKGSGSRKAKPTKDGEVQTASSIGMVANFLKYVYPSAAAAGTALTGYGINRVVKEKDKEVKDRKYKKKMKELDQEDKDLAKKKTKKK